jgi:hypothetical protein
VEVPIINYFYLNFLGSKIKIMSKIGKVSYLFIAIATLIWAGCAGTKASKESAYIGDWEYLVKDTPNGDVTGIMVISKGESGFVGKLATTGMGEITLNNLTIVEDKLSANFDIQGMQLDMYGTFEGPQFNGNISVDYNSFQITATKKQ